MRSVCAASPVCIELLLKHAADPKLKSTLGYTALHYAAYYQDDEDYLAPLLNFGAG